MNPRLMQHWTPQHSEALYGINDWGAGYFGISDDGNVTVNVTFPSGQVQVPLTDILSGITQRGMQMPMLLRIENFLDAQLARLNNAFRHVIESKGYQGKFQGVFPIKVNQQFEVIEEITRFGARYNHGLEAGSKPELLIALSTLRRENSLIICNGYKDQEFIDLGLMATKLGYRCAFVLETPAELPILLKRSKALNIRPLIGIRAKLASTVGGQWRESSGDRSIFGLTVSQIIDVVDDLRNHGMLDCLQLLHYHLGSQIPNIRDIRTGVQEACRIYIDLIKEGAPMGHLDMGGGLAVDYTGSKSNFLHSRNYTMEEYCANVVEVVMDTLDSAQVPHPTIVTESGRPTVAFYSLLLFNIFDVTHFEAGPLPEMPAAEEHRLIHNLYGVLNNFEPQTTQECYNSALIYRDEIRVLFQRGEVDLRTRSLAENLVLEIFQRIATLLDLTEQVPKELEGLRESLADIYYANMSVFQSLPDHWAIGQIFPVMPIHRHNERPARQAIIADITCDCDGKLDQFIVQSNTQKTLPLHPLIHGEEYVLAAFMVGAYQETLGDLHNLFGDSNVASVRINEDGSFDVTRETPGDSTADLLGYVEYNTKELFERYRQMAEKAVRRGTISIAERQQILEGFSAGLRGYPYYEK